MHQSSQSELSKLLELLQALSGKPEVEQQDEKDEKKEVQDSVIKQFHIPHGYPVSSGARFTAAQKLSALRKYLLEDSFITDELAYYVPPNGEALPGTKDGGLLQPWIEKEFLASEARVLLLKGPGGSGKSTFNRYLLRQIWQSPAWSEWKPGEAPPKAYVPLFIPLGESQTQPKRLFDFLSNLPSPLTPFSAEEINVIKADYAVLLIADGYDELPNQAHLNLYDVNALDRYEGRVKLLISTRPAERHEKWGSGQFVPHRTNDASQLEWRYYRERYVAPFGDHQIESYLTQYLHKNKGRSDITLWPNVATYLQQFEAMPELRGFIGSPFLLWMSAEVLPAIVHEVEEIKIEAPSSETKSEQKNEVIRRERQTLTRIKLYHHFMSQWFSRQAKKAVAAKDFLENPADFLGIELVESIQSTAKTGEALAAELLQQAYQRFCQTFAFHLRVEGRVSVQHSLETKHRPRLGQQQGEGSVPAEIPAWVTTLFASSEGDWLRIRKGCPIRQGGNQECQFLNPSLIDYFVTTIIAQQAQVVPVIEEKVPTSTPASSVTTVARKRRLGVSDENQLGSLITQILLTRNAVQLCADDLKEVTNRSRNLKNYYNNLIEVSKKNSSGAIAAANSITILNAAGENLSSRNFQGIHISGADLSGALLDKTDFTGSDLRQVIFKGAWMAHGKLTQSYGEGIRFGEKPYFKINGKALCCRLSHNEQYLAVLSDRISIDIFDLQNHRLICQIVGLFSGLADSTGFSVGWDPSDERLVSYGYKSVNIWNAKTGELQIQLMGHRDVVRAVTWHPSGERIASGGGGDISGIEDFTIRIWNSVTGEFLSSMVGHTKDINSIDWSSNGELLVSASKDMTVRIWDVLKSRELHRLRGHTEAVNSVVWTKDGAFIASGSDDGTIRIWDATDGALVRVIRGDNGKILSVTWDHTDQYLFSGSTDGTVRMWDVSVGKEVRVFNAESSVNSLAWMTNGSCIISGSDDQLVRIWETETEPELHPVTVDLGRVRSLDLDPSGEYVLSAGSATRVWEANTGKEVFQLPNLTIGCNRILMLASEEELPKNTQSYEKNTLYLTPEGYDLISMSTSPTVENIKNFSIKSNAAYVRHANQLFYANEIKSQASYDVKVYEIKITEENLQIFDARMRVSALQPDQPRTLIAEEIENLIATLNDHSIPKNLNIKTFWISNELLRNKTLTSKDLSNIKVPQFPMRGSAPVVIKNDSDSSLIKKVTSACDCSYSEFGTLSAVWGEGVSSKHIAVNFGNGSVLIYSFETGKELCRFRKKNILDMKHRLYGII